MEKEKMVVLVPAIEEFGKIYNSFEERRDWETFMLHVQTTCEQLMRGKVQTSVTSRLKSWDSLRKKLTKWHKINAFSDANAILDGLAENHDKLDIIGARIRAFFPKQLKIIYEILDEFFTVFERKPFRSDYVNKDELPAVSEKFGNYEAIHYWVKFKRNDTGRLLEPGLWEKFKGHTFEIQVRSSMLLDSWAEVRHDITYKALGGFPDRSERELLDTIKGVVISMEVLLNHLLDVHEDRIKSDETKFESMELFEQALVRALPQLAQAHEGIQDVQILRDFLDPLSINTLGEFKRVMRKTTFARDFPEIQKTRTVSKAPIWAFILYHVSTTLSRENVVTLIEKVPDSNDPHQILCLTIWHLQQYLFSPGQHDRPDDVEIKRCTLFWNLHEYICATWPKRDSEILALIRNLLVEVIDSPVPRVDIALFVAFAETLSYKRPYDVLGIPLEIRPVFQGYRLLVPHDKRMRWHRHNEYFDQVDIASQFADSSWSAAGVELLELEPDRSAQFRGAILHRAVSHPNENVKLVMVRKLLGDGTTIDINFANDEGESTLLVATSFTPTIQTIELLLNAGADVNKADRLSGATPLLIASAFQRTDLQELLLKQPEIDVNLVGCLTLRLLEMAFRYVNSNESLRSIEGTICSSDPSHVDYGETGGRVYRFQESRSLAQRYVKGHEWPALEAILNHSSFAVLRSFRTWDQFLECIATPTLTDSLRTMLLEKAITVINESDSKGCRLLGGVLRHFELSSNQELVRLLLKSHADASLSEPDDPDLHMLLTVENIETFVLVFESMSAHQLMAIDSDGRTLLHLIARGRSPDVTNDANYQVKLSTLLKSADVDKTSLDLQGRTWVHHAIFARGMLFSAGFIDECLYDDQDGVGAQLVATDNDGWTPLHWLCYAWPSYTYIPDTNVRHLLRVLLQNGADPDQACNHGWTPRLILVLLKSRGFEECRELLPPLMRDPPFEEPQLPGAVLSAFQRDRTPRVMFNCEECNGRSESRWTRYSCTTCPETLCFKCGWTKEKILSDHTYTERGADIVNRCFDDLQEGIRYASAGVDHG